MRLNLPMIAWVGNDMRIPLLGVFLSSCLTVSAIAADTTVNEARQALRDSVAYVRSISTEGGFLWVYSLDLKTRAGETKAIDSQIWVQPPGTPSMGSTFVAAYRATGDGFYRDAARDVAAALSYGQLESGGWDYAIGFDSKWATRYYRRADVGKLSTKEISRRRNTSTYDDNTTQSALRFLMDYVAIAPNDKAARASLDYGLKKLLAAQYPNGAWPQRYRGDARSEKEFPVLKASIPKVYSRQYEKRSYTGHYTLNDNTQRDVIMTVLKAWKQFGNAEYLGAVKHGGEFLLRAQLPEPQPVWAQQYNARMEPDWARAFEPPAACGGESVGAMRMLMELYVEFGDEKYLEPIPRAFRWYERSQVGENKWNRYYELGSNRPIFGDRDGKIYYRLSDISEERRNNYSWQSDYGFPSTKRAYEKLMNVGREAIARSRVPKQYSAKEKTQRMRSLAGKVRKVVSQLDEKGRWITTGKLKKRNYEFDDRIETSVFMKNANVLIEFLQLAR